MGFSSSDFDVHEINGTRYGHIVNWFKTEEHAREFAEKQHSATGKQYAVVCGVVTVMRTDDP